MRVGGIHAYGGFDHLLRAQDVGAGQIDLVDHRDHVQAVVDGQVGIGQGLRLHALRGVHHQQSALAAGQGTRDLVGKIHVPGSIQEVELVHFAIPGEVVHAHRMGLDGDAALAFQIHGVQHLGLHLPRRQRAGQFEQAVGKGGFAVVNVGDDREIADVLAIHERLRGRTVMSASGPRSSYSARSSMAVRAVPAGM